MIMNNEGGLKGGTNPAKLHSLKNQITIILFKIWPTNRFSKAKSLTFIFTKTMSQKTLSANGLQLTSSFELFTFCLQHPNFAKKFFQKGIDFGFLHTVPKTNEKNILHWISAHIMIEISM